jgi:hypothetical protein
MELVKVQKANLYEDPLNSRVSTAKALEKDQML